MRILVISVIALLLHACSSTPDSTGVSERFHTEIFDNGTKLFLFEFSRNDRTRPIVPYDQSGGFTDGRAVYSAEELRKRNRRYLRHALERTLEESGYCREGYYTLDTLIGYGNASLRGECREAASEEDRRRFPSTTITDQRTDKSTQGAL